MGDTRHELSDRLHLLGLEQLALKALLIRQVAHEMQEAALATQLHDSDLDLDREFGAVRPAPPISERATALGPDDLAAAGHLALVGEDELPEVAAQHLASIDAVQADRSLVCVEDRAVERGDEDRVRRLLEQRAVALFGRNQSLAQAVVGQGDARDPSHRVQCRFVERERGRRLLEEAQQGSGQFLARANRDRTERAEACGAGQR